MRVARGSDRIHLVLCGACLETAWAVMMTSSVADDGIDRERRFLVQ